MLPKDALARLQRLNTVWHHDVCCMYAAALRRVAMRVVDVVAVFFVRFVSILDSAVAGVVVGFDCITPCAVRYIR